ncbi:ABC transporter permease [Enterococcus sp. DIV0876]|uniref:ABC transporter permease n=1 Tax=Enterococcus sp. DIV0876 TaxID=2774633 RepID=UPI003D2FBF0C
MMTLIENEWLKLTKKKSTWIMLGLLVLLTFGITYVVRLGGADMKANDLFVSLSEMTSFLNLIVVIVAASSVAEEFTRGTIKFLLIRPFTRTQILAAKAINILLFAGLGTVCLMLSSFIASNLFLRAESPLAATDFNGLPAVVVALVYAATNLLMILFYLTLTMFISAVIRSQSLAVGLGVGMLFGSSIINSLMLLALEKYPWLKWNPFNMMNIRDTIPSLLGNPQWSVGLDTGLGYGEMAISLLVYSCFIYFITNWLFNKRDVALS